MFGCRNRAGLETMFRNCVSLLLISLLAPAAPFALSRAKRVDMLLLGGTVVTMDGQRRLIDDGAVAVADGKIVAVGKRAEIEAGFSATERIDTEGKVIVPGLINGHTHAAMTLFRGLADDLNLDDWLTKFIFPAEA